MKATVSSSEWRVTGRFVFGLLAGFFGVIVAVNVTLAVFARTTWTGLVVENGYIASQHFNRDLAQARRQQQLGWTERLDAKHGTLILELSRWNGSPISGLDVFAHVARPIGDRDDAKFALIETRPGHYESQAKLALGRWLVDVTATNLENETLRKVYHLVITEPQP